MFKVFKQQLFELLIIENDQLIIFAQLVYYFQQKLNSQFSIITKLFTKLLLHQPFFQREQFKIIIFVLSVHMTETQLISQLKFRVASLESALSDKQKEMQELHDIESQADSKIKAMNKIHNQKVKSLLNSLQILKKEKASIEGLSKQHKRSKLIEQLNKQIMDQDLVIDVLRKYVYEDKGKDKGREICDQIIVKALTKGPDRVRAVTRQQLKMEIDKLKAVNFNLQGKAKGGKSNQQGKAKQYGQASQISSVSQRSFVNQNEEIYKKLRDTQNENENLKLQISTKGKIIQKLKGQVKERDRLRGEVELLTNELQVSSRKMFAFQQLLRDTKQNMNSKIADLYERQLKVEQLELNSRQNGERLKQAHESTNLLLEQAKQQKEQLMVELQLMKKQNETLMLQNITTKKRQQQQKNKIVEIREINSKNKEELGQKLKQYQIQITKVMTENTNLTELSRKLENDLFKERADWVQEKAKLIEEMEKEQLFKNQAQLEQGAMEELNRLRKQNQNLKQLLESGTGVGSDSKILLERLQNYRIRLEFYENKGGKGKERQLYDQLFQKYNNLLTQYEKLKRQGGSKIKPKKMNIVEVTRKEEANLNDINSSISKLGLSEVGSSILDNFDSSYQYELRVDDLDRRKIKGLPKMSEEDKQLLKLINSDLWQFVRDDKIGTKIQQAISVAEHEQAQQLQQLAQRIRKIKNLSHPQGKKLVVYDSEIKEMDALSENVSVTSALQRDMDKFDSDVEIEVKKTIEGSPDVNLRQFGNVSDNYNSSLEVSSVKSGESNFVKKKRGEKASVIKLQKGEGQMVSSAMGSSVGSDMNSSVSSVGVKESMLADMDSQISVDFRKKKHK